MHVCEVKSRLTRGTPANASRPYRVKRDVGRAFTERQYPLLRTMVYVDLGVRVILVVFVDDCDELLEVVFAVLGPDRFVELRHVHKELEGLRVVWVRRQKKHTYVQAGFA